MKKSILFLASIALLFTVISCNKSNANPEVADESVSTQVDESGKKKQVNLIPSVLFYDEGSLWSENSDGELVRYTVLTVGQALNAYPYVDGSEIEEAEAKSMKKSGQKGEDVYLKVRYDNKDYWILKDLVIVNAYPSVVIESGLNYTSDKIDGVSSVSVPVGKIVAVHNDYTPKEDDGDNVACYKVTWRKGSERSYRGVYLKKDMLTTNPDDVLAQRILNKLAKKSEITDEVVIAEEFENLQELDLSSYYKDLVSDVLY